MPRQQSHSSPGAVLIAGPTASGKSAVALELADRLGGVVINTDSMQVYRDLAILTARPPAGDEARVPHRLFGFVDGGDAYSAGRWLEEARRQLKTAHQDGRLPIFVGGTGLYFESLTNGLARVPAVSSACRAKWKKRFENDGLQGLRDALVQADPEMAERIPPTDPQRMLRALEVMDSTGRSLGEWHRSAGPPAVDPAVAIRLVIAPARSDLHKRIDARAAAMIGAGALGEVEALIARKLDRDLPIMKAIGVRELEAVLAGSSTAEEALERIRTATRRYAKRQLTWARQRMGDWRWVDPGTEDGVDAALSLLESRRARRPHGA